MQTQLSVQRFPAHGADVVMTPLGLTPQGWAQADTNNVNRQVDLYTEALARHRRAVADDAPTAAFLKRSVDRLAQNVGWASVRCTNSGMIRTACTTCDHSRQLAALASCH